MSTETEQIFERLAAPFANEELKTRRQDGREMSYITARTARRRLNEVLGPQNWSCHLEPAANWVKCVLTITLPDGKSVAREAMGGYPRMPSEEDKVKGGDSDAFKRACVTFGIAEYLYGDEPAPAEHTPDARSAPRPAARPQAASAAPRPSYGAPREERSYDNSRPPTTGAGLYGFCCKQEELYGLPKKTIINRIDANFGPDSEYGQEIQIHSNMYKDWPENHVRAAAQFAMEYLSRRPDYHGEFDKYLERGRDRNHAPVGEDEEIPF